MAKQARILFVCMGNCVRSQMAEALARHYHGDVMIVESAGLRPLGFIDPTARSVIESRGISMQGQFSKGMHNHSLEKPDLIVNMSGLPGAHVLHGHAFEDWAIADPFGEDVEAHSRICEDIEARLKQLAERLREDAKSRSAAS